MEGQPAVNAPKHTLISAEMRNMAARGKREYEGDVETNTKIL